MKNPAEVARKWARNTANSAEDMKAGIAGVKESPSRKAAQNMDGYLAGIQRAVDDGRTKAAMEAVTLEDWQAAALEKGVPNAIAASRRPAVQAKVLEFQEQFLPFVESVAERVRKMPNVTIEDGIARAVAQIEGTARFRFNRRR